MLPPLHHRASWIIFGLLAVASPVFGQPAPGFKVPAEFEVTEYAGSDLANDIYTMTVDPKGRIVVAGRGYIRILVDSKGNGKADQSLLFADGPKDGAMGLLWEGDTLLVTGDGGLRRYPVAANGNQAAGPSKLIRSLKTGREHGGHALRRGPDGWLYLLCGNDAGIDSSYAQLPTSPVTKPVAGCVLRFTPELKKSEIVAHGFRNPYGMDFNSDGELFTFDSDNERCVSLPWYEPTRFYHVIPGGFYGWLSPQHAQFWRYPPWFVDVVAPVATLGRGSPTGVACYRHIAFPEKYQGGIFLADWTFGKIYHVHLKEAGSSYSCKPEIFLESTGDNGFAPTALVVHPQTGDLFVSIGGRGTRGAVYRIHHKDAPKNPDTNLIRKLQPAARSLDWPACRKELLEPESLSPKKRQRLQTLNLMWRHAARFEQQDLYKAIVSNWDDADQHLRSAAAALVSKVASDTHDNLAKSVQQPRQEVTFALVRCASQPNTVCREMSALLEKTDDPTFRLEALRVLQIALGDVVARKHIGHVWEGYTLRMPLPEVRQKFGAATIDVALTVLRRLFPAKDRELNLELARTIGLLEDPSYTTLKTMAAELAREESPVDQFHFLTTLSRLTGLHTSAVRTKVAAALLGLEKAIQQEHLMIDSHWPIRLKEVYVELARHDPKLHEALLQHKEFGRPEHALFALVPGFNTKAAARLFLKRTEADDSYPWNADLVNVIAALPAAEANAALRPLWGKAGLDSVILPVLAGEPEAQDRGKFVNGLRSPQLSTVRLSLGALKKLPPRQDADETLALLTALNRIPADKEEKLTGELTNYLEQRTGQKFGADRKAWAAWFEKAHPKLAAKLGNVDGIDVAAWKKRYAQLKWAAGDAKRGAAVFRTAGCAACHSGGQWLAPDLHGVAKRFSQEDLFWAIVQPSRDVPERYQVHVFETKDGKLYQGMIVYQATDGVLLQTGATTTVRIAGSQIAGQQPLPNSLMPAGLLDRVSDHDIVDLFAFLREQ